MEEAFNTAPIADFDTIPVMYQGASDDFQGPTVDMPMPSEADDPLTPAADAASFQHDGELKNLVKRALC